ncbi:MAG: hypothetical protein U0974_11875 [Gemmatimonadales bacterium]|nr:hypothetical protein [Gemmatimonadales bacterium]MDZ4390414.1 hypothetical protein [Gemmatimonadales bacterium]
MGALPRDQMGLLLLALLASDPRFLDIPDLAQACSSWLLRHAERTVVIGHWPLAPLPAREGVVWWERLVRPTASLASRPGSRRQWGTRAGTRTWPLWWDPSFHPRDAAALLPTLPSPHEDPASWQDWVARRACPDWKNDPTVLAVGGPPVLPPEEPVP